MKESKSDFSRGIEVLQRACEDAEIAFLPQKLNPTGPGTIPVYLGKAVSHEGQLVSRSHILYLSRMFLADLPAMREYQEKLSQHLHSLSLRLSNPNEDEYITLAGIPIQVEMSWPLRIAANRDAFTLRVGTQIRTFDNKQANFAAFISGTLEVVAFPSLVPVFTESALLNAVRKQMDAGRVTFYELGKHPSTLQPVSLTTADYDDDKNDFRFMNASDAEISEFIKRKVYWLGFRAGSQSSAVWVADPYDAQYLGTTPRRMRQIAEVLGAQDIIHLESERDFACTSKELLKESRTLEQAVKSRLEEIPSSTANSSENQQSGSKKEVPSAFISYSSQDREFAEGLAIDLKNRNLDAWFDQWEIRVGDSLIDKIGQGIRHNDFLIVVLSPHSVASEWVKKELCEAMQREIKEQRVVVLPVLLKSCPLPPFLRDKKYADFRDSYEQGFKELVQSITR